MMYDEAGGSASLSAGAGSDGSVEASSLSDELDDAASVGELEP